MKGKCPLMPINRKNNVNFLLTLITKNYTGGEGESILPWTSVWRVVALAHEAVSGEMQWKEATSALDGLWIKT